jgi:hypothetical protein
MRIADKDFWNILKIKNLYAQLRFWIADFEFLWGLPA